MSDLESKNIVRTIAVKSEHERLVYAVVFAPLKVDTDTEAMTRSEIKKMAYSFLANKRTDNIDVKHDYQKSGAVVVESFLARADDPDDFPEGAWVLVIYIEPDDLWDKVLSGELNGLSWAGDVEREIHLVKVTRAVKVEGTTEMSLENGLLPPHSHKVMIRFDDNGKVIKTETEETLGHVHEVIQTTATGTIFEHGHRLLINME